MTQFRLLSVLAAFLVLANAARSQSTIPLGTPTTFTAGDILVERLGNGTASLTSAATPIFLDDYSPAGVLEQSIALPTTGNNTSGNFAITDSGSAASQGFLTVSSNGRYIAFTGYSANVGVAGITSTTSAANPRLAGTLSFNGAVTVTSLGATAFNANNYRSAFTNGNGTNVWAGGNGNATTEGVWSTNGSTPTQLAALNVKTINGAGGQLFVSNGTAILAIGSGDPVSGAQTNTTISANVTAGNIVQFFFADLSNTIAGPDTLYVSNQANGTVGIDKFTLTSGNMVSGTWVASGSANIGSLGNATSGALGLTGKADANGNVTIYGTTAGGIFDLVDTSGYDGALEWHRDVAGVGRRQRSLPGVAFAPVVPEPGETAALIGGGTLLVAMWRRRRRQAIPPAVAEIHD